MDSECPSCHYPLGDAYATRVAEGKSVDIADAPTPFLCPNCGVSLLSAEVEATQTLSLHIDSQSGSDRRFAHFQLLKILGQGGFGTVWLANDLKLERNVALKLPVRKQDDFRNLMREAKTAAKLRHPNIVSVHEVGEHENQLFIVCEYIEGMDLRELLREGLLPEQRVIELLRAIAHGLHHAHENQIVHRDMKPANVLVDHSGTPLVTDFGLAKMIDVEESISSKGKIVGSIMYMSPEQAGADADKVDRRADIYAIGVMMYEMLTGERPYRGSAHAIMQQKMNEDPAPLRTLRPSVALDLETICLKCLQRAPARRYETAMEFIDELDRYQNGEPILARPVSNVEYAWRWCKRNRAVASLLTLLFLSLSIGLAGTTFYWLQARDYLHQAEAETEKTQRSLYASRMTLAADLLSQGEIEAAGQMLDRFRSPELEHFRGFEWHYLVDHLARFKQSVQHGSRIEGIAISRDGNWFASIADDRALRIWDSQSGDQIREIPFKVGRWQAIAISPRDNLVAAGSKDGTVYLWKTIQDESLPPQVIKHGVGVTRVKFSADGKRLFSAGSKGAIRVWNTSNLEMIEAIPTGQEGLIDFAVSKDGSTIVTGGDEGVLRAWNVDSRTKLTEIRDGHPIRAITVAPDGKRFVIGTFNGRLVAYDTNQGATLFTKDTRYDWLSRVEFLANSSVVAACSSIGGIAFFDVDQQRELDWIMTHSGAGGTFAISSNGKAMLVGAPTGAIRLLDTSDFRRASVIPHDLPVRDTQILSDQAAVTAFSDGSVGLIDFEQRSLRLLKQPDGAKIPPVISVAPDLGTIAIAIQDGSIELLDEEGKLIETIPSQHFDPARLKFSSSGDLLLVAGQAGTIVGYSIQLHRDSIATESFSLEVEGETIVRDVAVTGDRTRLAVGLSNHQVRFYDLSLGNWLAESIDFESAPISIAFAEQDLVVGTRDAFLSRVDRQTLRPVWRTKAHIGHLNMIAIIPNGNAVATVGRDRFLRIWDLMSGDLRVRISRHPHQVFAVSSSSDGKTLVTGGVEGQTRVWRGVRP